MSNEISRGFSITPGSSNVTTLFMPAAGWRSNDDGGINLFWAGLNSNGRVGLYWSSNSNVDNVSNQFSYYLMLRIYNQLRGVENDEFRADGMSVRCIAADE